MANKNKYSGDCSNIILPIMDTLDVINGKWKILIIISIKHGNKRFGEIEKSIPKLSSKVLAKELKDLEIHQLVTRTVYDGYPVSIEYATTEYAETLSNLITEMKLWGQQHRKKIMAK
ncbi:MAG TPA: helix-turn-helix domain-containing protein [Puia sp.]|nr:helix-turn-helix domain-containing protein [Puia sp.]